MNMLTQKIITTLAYYDAMDYPMTAFEVWKYLISHNAQQVTHNTKEEEISLLDIIKELENEDVKKHIDQFRGYYFLKGIEGLVKQRLERNKIAEQKFKTTRHIVKWLRLVPYIRMVAATGTLAMKNTQKKSDLDLLIVLKHGHIFTGRTLVTGLVHFLGVRRYGDKISNRICLNFFITDESLEISLKDLFSANEYSFIWPLFDQGIFRKFQEANKWIENFKGNFQPNVLPNLKMPGDNFGIKMIRKIGETILSFSFLEKWLKNWQIQRIAKDPRTHLAGAMVMADDNALIFLPEPQGPEIFLKFKEKLEKVGNS
jgi:hypothetical protein